MVTKEYRAWQNMKNRCLNPKTAYYYCYGGRGITICDRWINSFANFLADMGPAPSKHHSIDRHPNNNGNYEPGNCRWATIEEQSLNKNNTAYLTINSETKPLKEWCDLYSISEKTFRSRVKSGMVILEALTKPIDLNNKFSSGHKRMYNKEYATYEMDGISKTLFEWCKVYNAPYDRTYNRLHSGMDIKTALTKPINKHSKIFPKIWQRIIN